MKDLTQSELAFVADVLGALELMLHQQSIGWFERRKLTDPQADEMGRVARRYALVCQAARSLMGDPRPIRMYIVSLNGEQITCLHCGSTSNNENDVRQRYCGHCKRFLEF